MVHRMLIFSIGMFLFWVGLFGVGVVSHFLQLDGHRDRDKLPEMLVSLLCIFLGFLMMFGA